MGLAEAVSLQFLRLFCENRICARTLVLEADCLFFFWIEYVRGSGDAAVKALIITGYCRYVVRHEYGKHVGRDAAGVVPTSWC